MSANTYKQERDALLARLSGQTFLLEVLFAQILSTMDSNEQRNRFLSDVKSSSRGMVDALISSGTDEHVSQAQMMQADIEHILSRAYIRLPSEQREI